MGFAAVPVAVRLVDDSPTFSGCFVVLLIISYHFWLFLSELSLQVGRQSFEVANLVTFCNFSYIYIRRFFSVWRQ